MKNATGMQRFRVIIDYRTKRGLATWAGMIEAEGFDQASERAERQILRRLRRSIVRIDRIIVN